MSVVDIQEMARIAGKLIQAEHHVLKQMQFPDENERHRLVMTLLMASLDHAESAAVLLAAQPNAYGVSAVALYRPQLETFCRAVMFSLPGEVSDEQVLRFISKDELPKRVTADGKHAPIWFEAVSNIALREMNRLANDAAMPAMAAEPFKRFLDFDKKDLHGFIHGGKVLFHMYRHDDHGVGFSLSHETARLMLLHVGRLSTLALVFVAERLARGGAINPDPFAEAMQEFCEKVAYMPMDLPLK